MSSWRECTLAEITSVLGDGLHGTPKYNENGEYFFINGNNLSNGKVIIKNDTKRADILEYTKYKKNLNDRTILVSINGTLGNIALYNNEKCILGKSACYFNVNNDVDKYFIKYVVTNKDFQEYIRNFATGTTIPNVSLKTMREYSFSIPPLEEQKAIAEVLSSLDDKIDLLHRQNRTLESLAQTLFRQWFIEEAKDEWDVGTLDDIVDFNPTYKLKQGELATYLAMENVQTDRSSTGGWYKRETASGAKFMNDDTLLARITPSLENGKTAFVDFLEDGEIGWGSTEFIVMRMKNGYHPFISYLIAKNQDFRDFAIGNMTGSTGRQRAQVDDLKKYEIIIPASNEIEKLNELLKPIPVKIKANWQQIQTMETLRDTLLPKLLNGEIRIKYE